MPEDMTNIMIDIEGFIHEEGGDPRRIYVGIAADPESRLRQHGVRLDIDPHITRQAQSSEIARDIEDYFVNDRGTAGGTGGGDEDTDWVYAYRILSHTKQ